MKKFFAIILTIVVTLSMCACSGSAVNQEGEVVESANVGEIIFEYSSDEWVVSKLDKSIYHTSSFGSQDEFSMIITNDKYACYVVIDQKCYTMLENGDIIAGRLVERFEGMSTSKMKFVYNGKEYHAVCYDKHE